MSIRIIAISDTHGQHELLKNLPEADMIICAGDISATSTLYETQDFIDWFGNLPYRHKCLVPGNHDWPFVDYKDTLAKECKDKGIHLFIDSGCEIEGIKLYGSPVTPKFCNWCYNKSRTIEEALKPDSIAKSHDFIGKYWDMIPMDTDILITHGPAYWILDTVKEWDDKKNRWINKHKGCHLLLDKINQIKPKLHIFGHIHDGMGVKIIGDTTFINASCLNDKYQLVNMYREIDWEKVKK